MGKKLLDNKRITFFDNYDYTDEDIFYKSLKNEYYKNLIDLSNVDKLLCTVYHIDEENGIKVADFHRSQDDALKSTCLYYECCGEYKSISYKDLILNLPLIDFKYLLNNVDNNSITESFIEIFKITELYPNELSTRLRLSSENHEKLIEKYADKLNWNSIIYYNIPLSNEHVKKYYKYFSKIMKFYTDKKQTFDKETLKFVTEEALSKFEDIYSFYDSYKILFEKLLVSHNFSEDELFTILDTIRKDKTVEKNRKDWIFRGMLDTILETQDVDENLILRLKSKTIFKQHRNTINFNVKFSEKFIEENCNNQNIIDWDAFSENENILLGKYPNEFYKKYSDKIKWTNFKSDNLRIFSDNYKKRFKEFLIELYSYIGEKSIIKYLSSNSSCFSYKEIVKYFGDIAKTTEELDYRSWYTNSTFLIAACKAGNPNFSLSTWFKSEKHISPKEIELVKREILIDIINGKLRSLEDKTFNTINSIIEDKDIISMKKEIFTEMLDGDFRNKMSETMYDRIATVLGQK